MILPSLFAVALSASIDQRQVKRLALATWFSCGDKKLLEGNRNFFGKPNPDETSGCYRVPILDEPNGLDRRHNLSLLG